LTRVGQFGSRGAGTEHAWHEFAWFDDVTDPDTGAYVGFGDPEQWGSRTDTTRVNIAAESALGTSWRAGADGGAYIGFNPVLPSKIGSFGGSLGVAGGQSNDVTTLIDLDGDGLPDKVWVTSNGTVMYRPNLNRPGAVKTGDSWFGAPQTITGIDSMGRSSDLSFDIHFEAYPVVAIQVGGGFGFSFGDRYFEDVNGDGRVDFIKPGQNGAQTVFYNVLNNGVPTFIDSSLADQLLDRLEVPLDPFDSTLASAVVPGVGDLLTSTSPRIDTVRRWLAPHNGTVRVEGTASLTAGAAYRGDGAQVTIEHDGAQKWTQILDAETASGTHAIELPVAAGDAVWFRLHVIENAADDAVSWDPTITYLAGPGGNPLSAPPDANGRSQVVYNAAADFTLFGRTGARTALTEPGEITVDVAVNTLEALSDDLEVVALHGHGTSAAVEHAVLTVAHGTTGQTTGSVDLTVAAPSTNAGADGELGTDDDFAESDFLELQVRSDSPVDPTAFSVDITTSAPGFEEPDEINDIPEGADVDLPLDIPIVPNVRVFSRTDHTAPYVPITSPDQDGMKAATIQVGLEGPPIVTNPTDAAGRSSPAVLTVKTPDGGVVARSEFTVRHIVLGPIVIVLTGATTLADFTPERNTTYYVDVSVADPAIGAAVDLVTSTVTWAWTETETDENGDEVDVDKTQVVPNAGQLHWPDVDGMFPSANRGWAYAGYNADHAGAAADGGPLVESQFVFEAETNGFDEDTPVPSAGDAPSAGEVTDGVDSSFDPAFPYIPWAGADSAVADRWRAAEKETLNGTASTMQADRLGADTPIVGLSSTGRTAPQMVSVDGDFNFMLGLVASFTAAAGGGRELKGYEDYNGDGYPDIRSADSIEFTGPRGAKAATQSVGDNPFDTALALGGGLDASPVSISASGGSSKNNDGGGQGSNVEPTTTKSSRGMKLGLGFSIGAQWTNPIANGEAYSAVSGGGADAPDIQGDLDADRDTGTPAQGATGTPMDRASIDVNGDGLPDRVDTYTSGELWVNLNLGYRFADKAIQWSTGRTASNKDVSGSISAGFQLNAYEFAGGVAYSEGAGYSLFDWTDIDGDGVPDRMNNVDDNSQPRTVFGSGDGMQRSEIVYGTYPNGDVTVDAARFGNNGIPLPPGQMEVSRSTALSGGVDFTFSIGPICGVGCYVIINPGFHGGYDRTTSQVQMEDMNGDGYLDAVRSTDSEHVEVRLNRRGRTNMLKSLTNPLGGQVRLDYERTGNTIENPESVWVMSSVEVDDGRSGDGPDVQRSEFTYEGMLWDPLLRELLGFSSIREDQIDEDGGVLRSYERKYLNANPFETGTLIEERTLDAGGDVVQEGTFEWTFVNADPHAGDYGDEVGTLPALGTTARTVLFDTALSPRLVTDRLTLIDAEGDEQTVATHYTYNVIGDVVTVWEENEDEVDGDDTFTEVTYSDCAVRNGDRLLGDDDSWVSVPQTVTVYGNDGPSGERLRYRNGGPDLCVNAAPVRIAELVSDADENECGTALFAITELSFDTHGNFNSVARPANTIPSCGDYPPETVDSEDLTFDGCDTLSDEDDAVRFCVDYVYDPHRFTAIAEVTDNHAVTASATYDPYTGRLASRTDENGYVTTYTYDPPGRLSSITAPREQGSGPATVSYAYGGLAATLNHQGAHAWATARHHDQFNPGNAIDTVSFVDGMGRVVQRKRDAEVDGVSGEARIVEGAIEYDALGREVKEWYPVVEKITDRPLTTYNACTSECSESDSNVPVTQPIVRTFTTLDSLQTQRLPDGSTETVQYDFDVLPDSDSIYGAAITMNRIRTTDPLGKVSTRWLDVGGAVFLRVDEPLAANDPDGGDPLAALPDGDVIEDPRIHDSVGTPGEIRTTYEYDRLGRLTAVVDTVGARTEHTYDRQDAVTSTDTPDAGLVQRTFAPSGQLLTVERAAGTGASYSYDRDRVIGVEYSDGTPSVIYEYGDDGADENAAGRVSRVVDGSMERTYGYDVDGNVARETATRDADPFGTGVDPDPPAWETAWEYDSLGRLAVLTYPDGEELTHDYDLGGRPSRLVSQAPQHDLYDQYGDPVPRPDVEIVYIDAVRYDQIGEATFLRTGTGVETRYEREPTRRFLAGIDTDATVVEQFDGSISTARPLQRLEYTYDAVGNVLDTVNRLYANATDAVVTELGPPPENNVPGPSQHAFSYDGHYRLTGGAGTYIDRKENRDFTYETDYAANGNLLAKRQVTTTTSTTSNGRGNNGSGNGKKGDGGDAVGDTTTERTCESNTGSGGGAFNQDPETTYVIAAGDLVYAEDADGHPLHRLIRSGNREYTYDDNGNMTGWTQSCAGGSGTISRTLEWDAENRVTRLAEGNNDTEYRYNAEGERTLERGPGGTTWFVNEHWRTFNDGHRYANVYLGERLVASHRTSPQAAAPEPCTDTLEDPCTCGTDTACVVDDVSDCDVAKRVFDTDTSTCQPTEERTIHFLHQDLQGSLRVATDEVGNVFQYIDYLPTGRPWVAGQSTTKDTPYLFAGGWTDTTYDLVNFGERWYDPREQNFLSPEPLLEEEPYAAVDDPSLLAAYTYAASNPLRYVDPDGRAPKRVTVAIDRFDVGANHEKHQRGDISISVAKRAKRKSPAITFGGRYTNNAKGQQLGEAFVKHADRAERFSTILAISTEDGVRKIRVFGITVNKKDVPDKIAPDPGPGDTGADHDDAAPVAPDPVGKQPAPDAAPAADQASASAQANADAGGKPGDAGATTPPPDAGGDGADAPAPPPPPPPPPPSAAPSADGPDIDE
jgi:RHS repeat-associated protein